MFYIIVFKLRKFSNYCRTALLVMSFKYYRISHNDKFIDFDVPFSLQEAFFGKDILDKSKAKVKQGHRADSDSDPESRASTPNLPKDIPQPSLFPEMSQGNSKLPTTLPSVGTSQSVLSSAASIVSSFSGASGDINPIGIG